MNENQNKYVDINAHDNYPDSKQKIEVPTMKVIPLKKICMTIGELPTAYLETMTYYEMLVWFINYLRDNIIPTVNGNGEAVEELQNVVMSLQNYINSYKDSIDADVEELEEYMNNYFENLDVQEEINNKLDQMLKDGVLEQIIEQFIQSNTLWVYNTINDMITAPNLINGSNIKTLGYYSINDGGGALYKIRNKTENDIIDNGSIIKINDNLVAELIVTNEIKTKQFGAKGDGQTNDTDKIQKLFDYVSKENKGIRIIVNGMHLVNNGLIIKGTNDKLLSNVVITGLNGSRAYGNNKSLINGFKFVADYTSTQSAFDNTTGILFDYCYSPVIEYLNITSTETVENGDIPLNNTTAIKLKNSNGSRITHCNITNVYRGIYLEGSGLAKINDNNVSLCNLGIETLESGDNSLIDNYINTCGWDIRETDGTVKSKFSAIAKINRVFGMALYIGAGGNMSIRGGKIEWCNKGIFQDNSGNNIISSIQFDRCTCYGIYLDGNNHFTNRTIVANNSIIGCGGISDNSQYGSGSSICVFRSTNININSNNIIGAQGSLFIIKGHNYYGPKDAGINIIYSHNCSVTNNIINVESRESITGAFSMINESNNVTNKPIWWGGNMAVYTKIQNHKYLNGNNSTDYTYGNYDLNDVIFKQTAPNSGYRCTTAGTIQTINSTVSVITESQLDILLDKTILKLTSAYDGNINIGSYVTIDGVTGTKKIIDISYVYNDGYYIKLDSACDAIVTNAKMSNVAPVWTEF